MAGRGAGTCSSHLLPAQAIVAGRWIRRKAAGPEAAPAAEANSGHQLTDTAPAPAMGF